MASPADVQRLQQIRVRHADASTDWSLSSDGKAIFARVVPGTPPAAIVETTDDCDWPDRDFLIGAHADIEFLLRLLKDAFAEIRRLRPREAPRRQEERQAKPKDHAAECAMKCNSQAFRQYLIECHGLESAGDSIRVESRVRSILNVQSRGEINTDENARQRWFSLRADFEAWRVHA